MNMAVKSWQQCDWNSPYPERGRGLIAARPKGVRTPPRTPKKRHAGAARLPIQACRPPHALPRMPHAIRTPTNGVRTAGSGCGPAGTPVRPGSRKPLKSRGLRYQTGTLIRVPKGTLIKVPSGTLIRVPNGTLIRVPNRYPYKGTEWYPYKGTERYPYKGTKGLTRADGVRHAGVCTPVWEGVQPPHAFFLGVRGGMRTPFGRAAIKPQRGSMECGST
ncbi:hypothetical protein PCASD_09384 [Puccinia coronata f. sp. avenae]|uniref:Uncharacterized protein n=1 Tax=Puccinia coronata f. sp. avenae TaxID=200324 RepID=A0A2N5V1C2_9BASI|nr:hypothetical protein PCASD_09384 [Puccinia coronata f. sp. avenae]